MASTTSVRRVEQGLPLVFDDAPAIVEQFRRLRRTILQNQAGKTDATPVILFCSSASGEGVSTVCINFAAAAAAEGERVIMVDANLRQPCLHSMFGLPQSPGLAELILQQTTLAEAVRRTHRERLSLLPSGTPPANPGGLLKYPDMPTLFDGLRRQADLVVIDAPQANQYADAGPLGLHADQVYLVIQAEKTRWEAVRHATDSLHALGVEVTGAVLNRRHLYIPHWLYQRL